MNLLDRYITVRHLVYALALYAAYLLIKDHYTTAAIVDVMSRIQVV